MATTNPIDEYLSALDEPKRTTLTSLRDTIMAIVPDPPVPGGPARWTWCSFSPVSPLLAWSRWPPRSADACQLARLLSGANSYADCLHGQGNRSPFSRQRRRAAAECRTHPAVHNILSRITAGQRALESRCVMLCLLPTGAASPTVSHLISESRLEIKIEISRLPGAPLRNRTVDLLLTISTFRCDERGSCTDTTRDRTDCTDRAGSSLAPSPCPGPRRTCSL
jgi:hypothetical protein